MADLRIFSYLPNPRIWKSIIAARLNGVELDVRGDELMNLANWLWDFDARPLSDVSDAEKQAAEREARTGFAGKLYKTDAFLVANPLGTVPCAFSPDGKIGIFESNSIMRAVARLGDDRFPLYGSTPYEAARIDGFLDISLVFARDSQIYLLANNRDQLTADIHASAHTAFHAWMSGIEQGLVNNDHLVGERISLADICFICEFALFSRERALAEKLDAQGLAVISDIRDYPRAQAHLDRLCKHPAFQPELGNGFPALN
ncbi:MAG: glutathione S-transferase [Xanthomonadales bacterium]|nr:glutathione S-transferase [Xanthomonadales bacterium]